jgi:hypothetical protein
MFKIRFVRSLQILSSTREIEMKLYIYYGLSGSAEPDSSFRVDKT